MERNVADALERFGTRRIGHGLCAFRNPALLDRAMSAGVTFEICPTSSVRTGQISAPESHPARLAPASAALALGADDPAVFGTTLPEEAAAAARLGLSPRRLARAACEAAFVDREERAALRRACGG
jgi:aminodeoxyfutalosine deaminase